MKRYLAGFLAILLTFQLSVVPAGAAESEDAQIEYAPLQYQAAEPGAYDLDDELMMGEVGCEVTYQGGAFTVAGMETGNGVFLTYAAASDFDGAIQVLYEKMLTRSVSIDISAYRVSKDDSKKLLQAVANEHPDLYYLTRWTFSYNTTSNIIGTVYPVYTSEDNFDETAYEAGVADALSVVTEDMSNLQKVIALHDYIVANCEYDTHYRDALASPNRFNTYGVFVDHVAVCQGYALAYKYLLNRLGIECYMVTSEDMNHTWNLVGLDGKYYQVDATWDDPMNNFVGRVYHKNLLCSDVTFRLSKGHYNWVVTDGAETVTLEAEDGTYEVQPYMQTTSPIVMAGNDYYYLSYDGGDRSGTIVKYDCQAGTESGSVFKFQDGIWQSSSVETVYSGLFQAGGRLWFNKSDGIYSVFPDGTGLWREYQADTSDGYLYSSVLRRGEVLYQSESGPSASVRRGNVKKADLSLTDGNGKVVLSEPSLVLTRGETAELNALLRADFIVPKRYEWSTSDETVVSLEAEVSSGNAQLTARSKGNATVTVTVRDDKNRTVAASCAVTVEPIRYKVIFMGKYGKLEEQVVEEGTAAVVPENAECPGYTLTGWDKDFSRVTGDMTVTAGYTPITYQILYQLNGGELSGGYPKEYQIHQELGFENLIPRRSGYRFAGWYRDESCKEPFAYKAGDWGDLQLYAKWEIIVYKIDYELDGGENSRSNPKTYDVTSRVALEEPTRAGKYFVGWYRDSAFTELVAEIPQGTTGDLKLYAKWAVSGYSVLFSGNAKDAECEETMTPLACAYERIFRLPRNRYYRKGYTFAGWNTRPDGGGTAYGDEAQITGLTRENGAEITFYAQWKPIDYAIVYLNMGDGKHDNPAAYTIEQRVELREAARAGYRFAGWYSEPRFSESSKVTSLPAGGTGERQLYAKWQPHKYTVQFQKNHSGAKGTMSALKCEYGTEKQLPLNTFRRTGYTFSGWSLKADGSGTIFGDGEAVSDLTAGDGAKVKLYAVWKPTVYSIAYYNIEEDEENPNPETYDITAGVKLKKLVRNGYQFKGWYSDPKYKKKVTSIGKGSYGDKKLYAKWALICYNVSYSANGGKGTAPAKVSKQSVLEEITLAENPYTRKGYLFKEWNTKSNGKGRSYEPGASYEKLSEKSGATVKLYAVWTPVIYDISYENVEFDSEDVRNSNPKEYKVTQTVKLSKPARRGYVFQGWYKDGALTKKVTSIPKGSTGNKIFYAKWKEISYKVAYYANGGKGEAPEKEYGSATRDIVLQTCPFWREGYEFAGWNTKRNGKGIFYEAGGAYSYLTEKNGATVKLYAVWRRLE